MRFALALLLLPSIAFATPVLRRDAADYTLLAIRSARLKNLYVVAPGCNVGVNCARPHAMSSCGVLRARGSEFAGASQLVSDAVCATGSFAEVFRNNPGDCSPDCSTITTPGTNLDCSTSFATPILGDLDGDAVPSCSNGCVVDRDDVAAACGATLPFPACNPSRPVIATEGEDCSAFDAVAGNGRCDLAAGTYGVLVVRNGARVDFGSGTSVFCALKCGKATRLAPTGFSRVLVPGKGGVKLNNAADVGSGCHRLSIVTEEGTIHLGKHGDYTMDACAIGGNLRLGHDNTLRGQFVGDTVVSDLNNEAVCCTDLVTTTTVPGSTTTTTTVPGSTTTTVPGSTTTTTTTAPSTTSTTLPAARFTRTIGFYKTHPTVTRSILQAAGALMVCGRSIRDIDIDHAHSAIEALCVSPRGDLRLQLARQLTGAALTMAAGGATFTGFATCNAACADAGASSTTLSACINSTSAFNESGDALAAPWGQSPADPRPCQKAQATACTILNPSSCKVP